MRIGSLLLLIWLIIGVIVGSQHYYERFTTNCAKAGTIIATVLTGPAQLRGREPESHARHRSRATDARHARLLEDTAVT